MFFYRILIYLRRFSCTDYIICDIFLYRLCPAVGGGLAECVPDPRVDDPVFPAGPVAEFSADAVCGADAGGCAGGSAGMLDGQRSDAVASIRRACAVCVSEAALVSEFSSGETGEGVGRGIG